MTLNQLVCRAASVYPDGYVMEYWDPENEQPRSNPVGGDTLAQFIALELADTFDESASDSEKIATAARVMQTAADDLALVAHALSNMAIERVAA